MDKLCAIFANENLCVIYVTASEPTADKDAECRAELQEIMRIIGMKRKLVLSAISGCHIIMGTTHRGCHGNHSHDDREVASLYCNDWTLTIPDSVLCSSTCEGCLILLKQ